jgi:hypothetical protein
VEKPYFETLVTLSIAFACACAKFQSNLRPFNELWGYSPAAGGVNGSLGNINKLAFCGSRPGGPHGWGWGEENAGGLGSREVYLVTVKKGAVKGQGEESIFYDIIKCYSPFPGKITWP